MIPFIIQGQNITLVVDGHPHTITESHVSYKGIIEAIKNNQIDTIRDLINPKKFIVKYSNNHVEIEGENFLWKGKPMHNTLSNKMIEMLKEGFPIDPLVNFMHNLMKNPSKRAVDELYGFLEKGALPITPDGHFLAYKKVGSDFRDVHSGSVLNKPAYMMTAEEKATLGSGFGKEQEVTVAIENDVTVVSMERNQVDDNANNTCSKGLHFCSRDYLNHFGGSKVVILKINPADVVSIPSDYNDSKGRCCRYEVIGELDAAPEKAFTRPVQTNAEGIKRPEPKTGNSEFYRGYSDGFNDRGYNDNDHDDDYYEGYHKGHRDADVLGYARYVYVDTNKSFQAWPFPR